MERTPVCPAKLEKLMVCTDGSGDSQGAVAGALALAGSCGSKIFILQVLEFNPELEAQAPEYIATPESRVRDDLEKHRREAERLDIPVETRVRRCEAAYQGIVGEAEKIKPDLIVMGRRGGSRLFRLMMGSTTERVIAHAPCCIMVVKAALQ
jgi:nucleotide-binding universal stress UspA family protein